MTYSFNNLQIWTKCTFKNISDFWGRLTKLLFYYFKIDLRIFSVLWSWGQEHICILSILFYYLLIYSVVYSGSYHPYLEMSEKYFMKAARVMMSESSMASPLRFQNLEISYDSFSPYVFLIGTMVEPPPTIGEKIHL